MKLFKNKNASQSYLFLYVKKFCEHHVAKNKFREMLSQRIVYVRLFV